MANTKISCYINLTRNKNLITKTKNGDDIISFDVVENFNGQADKFGNTHNLQVYRDGQRTYIGNGKEQKFGQSAPVDDLPV